MEAEDERALTLAEEAAHLDKPNVRDTNVAVAKVLLQFFPGGGVVAEMMNRIPSKRAERQPRFAQRLAEELEAVTISTRTSYAPMSSRVSWRTCWSGPHIGQRWRRSNTTRRR